VVEDVVPVFSVLRRRNSYGCTSFLNIREKMRGTSITNFGRVKFGGERNVLLRRKG